MKKKLDPENSPPPGKGDMTRRRVIEQAAPILNQKGYAGTAMSDLMEATGLQKGGLYRHFATKEELALESLRYTLTEAERVKFLDIDPTADSVDQLKRFVHNFTANQSPVAGGCPILNSSVEYDDGNPAFRQEAADTVTRWIARLTNIIREGQANQTLRQEVEPELLARIIISTMEGALAIGRLAQDLTSVKEAGRFLDALLESYRVI